MAQASAARRAANAINKKAQHGARSQQIEGAYELWQKAQVAEEIYRKSYERVKGLYEKGVVAEQKHDEVLAQYQAAAATTKAAKSQYDMAVAGARAEDKEAAAAQVARVDGIIEEINLARDERYLLSPVDGEVAERFPKTGELVGQGSPIMSIVDMKDMWFTFAVREDMLRDIQVGNEFQVRIPALGDEPVPREGHVYPCHGYLRHLAQHQAERRLRRTHLRRKVQTPATHQEPASGNDGHFSRKSLVVGR